MSAKTKNVSRARQQRPQKKTSKKEKRVVLAASDGGIRRSSLLNTMLNPMDPNAVAIPDNLRSNTVLYAMHNKYTIPAANGTSGIALVFGGDGKEQVWSFKGSAGAGRDVHPEDLAVDLSTNYRHKRVVAARLTAYSDVQLAGASDVSGEVYCGVTDEVSLRGVTGSNLVHEAAPKTFLRAPVSKGLSVAAPYRARPFYYAHTADSATTQMFADGDEVIHVEGGSFTGARSSVATTDWVQLLSSAVGTLSDQHLLPNGNGGIVRVKGRIDLSAPATAAGALGIEITRMINYSTTVTTHLVNIESGEKSFNIDVFDREPGMVERVIVTVATSFDASPGTITAATTSFVSVQGDFVGPNRQSLMAFTEGSGTSSLTHYELDILYELVPKALFRVQLPLLRMPERADPDEIDWIVRQTYDIPWASTGVGAAAHAASMSQMAKRLGRFGRSALRQLRDFLRSPAGEAFAGPYASLARLPIADRL